MVGAAGQLQLHANSAGTEGASGPAATGGTPKTEASGENHDHIDNAQAKAPSVVAALDILEQKELLQIIHGCVYTHINGTIRTPNTPQNRVNTK